MSIDGAQRFQRIDGFGVNANSSSWNTGGLAPALDVLLDTMGVSLWRVIIESHENWEDTNDDNDPFNFNWSYYNALYATSKFQALWGVLGYLKARGASTIMLNVMGCLLSWMGRCVLNSNAEDEWVEMIVSLLYYARFTKNLRIDALGPMNEEDIGSPEGPQVDSSQYVRVLKKLSARMDALGLGDIRLTGPDTANATTGANTYMAAMLADSITMAKLDHFGLHNYSGGSGDADRVIKASAYPDRNFWMTEFSAPCLGCDTGAHPTDDWSFATQTVAYLFEHLDQGAAGALIWEGYDSYYEHHGSMSYWGLLSLNSSTQTYSPTKRFFANAQVFVFSKPGMFYVQTNWSGPIRFVSLYDPVSGKVSIFGLNSSSSDVSLSGTLTNIPGVSSLAFYRTTQSVNLERASDVVVANNAFNVQIPADSVFTLSNLVFTGTVDNQLPTVALTAPGHGTTVSGSAVALSANASDNVGVSSVQFLLDSSPLGTADATPPYSINWDTTSVANGAHTLGAQARDAAGNVGTAAPISVTVANTTSIVPRTLVGHTAVESNIDTNPAGMAEAFQYTAAASGTANQLSIYLDASNTASRVIVGIYANSGADTPGALLSQATITTPVAGWNITALPAVSITADARYWIAVLAPLNAGNIQFRDAVSGGKAQTSAQTNLTALPASWTSGTTYASSPMSAYAAQSEVPIPPVFLPMTLYGTSHE